MPEPADSHFNRVALHEAGHAVAHFVLGRPVVHVVCRGAEGATLPAPGTHLTPSAEATLWAAGAAAELRLLGSPREDSAEYLNWFMNGGHHVDSDMVSALADRFPEVRSDGAKAEAASLIKRYWHFVLDVAECLEREEQLDQNRIKEIAAKHSVSFAEATAV